MPGGSQNDNLNKRWRHTSQQISIRRIIFNLRDVIHIFLACKLKEMGICAISKIVQIMVVWDTDKLTQWSDQWTLRLIVDNCENKNLQNVCQRQIRKNIFPQNFLLLQYKRDPRPCLGPFVMASSTMGFKFRVFGFLPTPHANTNTKQMRSGSCHGTFYTRSSSHSNRSRCMLWI